MIRAKGLLCALRRIYAKLLMRSTVGDFFTFNTGKFRLYFFPTQLTYNIYVDKAYRVKDDFVIKKHLKKGGVAIDVGANIGSLTLLMSKIVDSNGTVLSFEPSKTFFSYLVKNININKLKNVSVHNIALGAEKGELYLNEENEDDTTFFVEQKKTSNKSFSTEIDTLDNFTRNFLKIDFLKIDVEGFELDVLLGAGETLKKTDVLYVEFSPNNLSKYKTNPQRIIEIIVLHFTPYYMDTHFNIVPFTYNPNDTKGYDLICIKRKE